MTLKEKGMKNAAISNYVKPVMKFCKVNRINLNSDIINIHMPRRTKTETTGAYSHLIKEFLVLFYCCQRLVSESVHYLR
jgi:hypothetical protein